MAKYVTVFRDRHPLIGPIFWLLSVQYFITQYLVAAAWKLPFSLRHNVMSDLGNTACGHYAGRYVCSPYHTFMNASFVVLGLTMILGSVFIPNEFRKRRGAQLGFYLMALAGVGTVVVGLFPENSVAALHYIGALLPFLFGNLALIVFGLYLLIPPGFKIYTVISGGVALAALGLFMFHQYFGLGQGGMERVVAYPQTIWLIFFGIYMSANHYRTKNGKFSS